MNFCWVSASILSGADSGLPPVEADAVHQLDQSGAAIVDPEPLLDELPDFGGRRRQHPRRPGAKLVNLEGRQRTGAALQVEQDEPLDAAFLEFLEPDADGRVVDEQRLGNLGEGPAPVEQQNGVRPAGDAILLQPVPGDRHEVGPIRCTEEITVRLHQATGNDPLDSVKQFSEGRGVTLYRKKWVTARFPMRIFLPSRFSLPPSALAARAFGLSE